MALSGFVAVNLGSGGFFIAAAYAGTIQLSDGPRVQSVAALGDRLRLCITRSDGSCTLVGPEEGFERSQLRRQERKLKVYAIGGGTAAAVAIVVGTGIAVCTLGEVTAAGLPLTAVTCKTAKEGALISALSYAEAATVLAYNKISPITFWRHAGEMRDILSDSNHFVVSDRTEKQFIADMRSVFGNDLELKAQDATSAR